MRGNICPHNDFALTIADFRRILQEIFGEHDIFLYLCNVLRRGKHFYDEGRESKEND